MYISYHRVGENRKIIILKKCKNVPYWAKRKQPGKKNTNKYSNKLFEIIQINRNECILNDIPIPNLTLLFIQYQILLFI